MATSLNADQPITRFSILRYVRHTLDVELSHFLSYVCRHGAPDHGIKIHFGGFLNLDDVLRVSRSHGGREYTSEDVKRLIRQTPREEDRFTLRINITGSLQIRANEGHSFKVDGLELTPILDADGTPDVVHGTSMDAWDSIKCIGLSRSRIRRRSRNHIKFSPGRPGDKGVRAKLSCSEVLIFIDLPKALAAGLKFYRSASNVILSPGNSEGIIPPEYFAEVREHPSGKVMHVPKA